MNYEELTIEQKAKAYDNLIERLKDFQFEYRFSAFSDTIERYFPELQESEDGWIKKEIINYLKEKGDFRSCWIAWLEKHEWKPSDIQIEALKIVKDYVVSNNWNDCVCNNLKNLLEQLKKL